MTASLNERAFPCDGFLHLDGWQGRSQQRVRVVGETPKRYRITAISETRLGGRWRKLSAGETGLVPKRAITFSIQPGVAVIGT